MPIEKNEVYGVRLVNESSYDAAVALSIDGVDSFQFSEIQPQPRFWVVPAKTKVEILGWHVTREKSLEFKVVDFPDTAAAKVKLKPSAEIGLITACFSAAWQSDSDKPSDEAGDRKSVV